MDKEFLLEMGARTSTADQDVLLKDKVSQRKRKQIERADELEDLEHEEKKAEIEKKTKAAEAAAKSLDDKPATEPPFKVTGGLNLGNINLQEQQQALVSELRTLKKEADDQTQATGQQNVQLRDKIHEKELEMLKVVLQTQLEASNARLQQLIEQGVNKKSFAQEYESAIELAKQLGFMKPEAGGDSMVAIELKKLDFDHQTALRKMSREEKASDRQWQIELRRLDDDRDARQQELQVKKQQYDLLSKTPEIIGQTIGRVLMEQGGIAQGGGTEPLTYHIEAKPGEAGTTQCPNCGTAVGIGPTSTSAICAKCEAKFEVVRTKAGSGASKGEASEGEE